MFAFGKNWENLSKICADFGVGRRSTFNLPVSVDLRGRRFLDIGFGQGLAAEREATVTVVDVDSDCLEAALVTKNFFLPRCLQMLCSDLFLIRRP